MGCFGKAAQPKGKGSNRNTNWDNPYGKKVDGEWEERVIPPELSDNDREILRHFRKRAYQWDMWFDRCCCGGLRFGWSAVIGLIPVIGDVLEVLIALNLVRSAYKLDDGLPKRLYSLMITNIAIDFAAGFIPVLGDIIDMFYRCNTRNAWILDQHLARKAAGIAKARKRAEASMRNPALGEKGGGMPQGTQFARPNNDLEQGMKYLTPAALPQARTPAPKFGNVLPNNFRAPTPGRTPGRSLTGRVPQDPREDYPG